jgi:hypothetical protein
VLIEQGHHRQLDQAKLSALKLLPKYRRTIIERMMVLRSVLLCAMMATVGAFTQSPAAFVIPKGELMTSSSVLPLTFLATGKKGYQQHRSMTGLKMSYVADSSDYGSDGESEYEDDAVEKKDELKEGPGYREFQDTPTQEEQPVPMSKNAPVGCFTVSCRSILLVAVAKCKLFVLLSIFYLVPALVSN